MFWFFGREARGILAHRPGTELYPPALDAAGPPSKGHGEIK